MKATNALHARSLWPMLVLGLLVFFAQMTFAQGSGGTIPQASKFEYNVPEGVVAGEVFTVTAKLKLGQPITGAAQMIFNFDQEITPISITMVASGTVQTEDLKIFGDYLYAQFPILVCPSASAAEVTKPDVATVISYYIQRGYLLQPGDELNALVTLRMADELGNAPKRTVWADGAFLAKKAGTSKGCDLQVSRTYYIDIIRSLFLPFVTN